MLWSLLISKSDENNLLKIIDVDRSFVPFSSFDAVEARTCWIVF